MREHLAQCEVCRAIVARFEAGDGNKNTLADQSVLSAWRGTSSAETVQVVGRSENAAGKDDGETKPRALADGATMDAARAVHSHAAADVGLVA